VAGIDDVTGYGSHLAYASEIKKCCGMLRCRGFVTHLAEMSLPAVRPTNISILYFVVIEGLGSEE
jgi:hypothetical protein